MHAPTPIMVFDYIDTILIVSFLIFFCTFYYCSCRQVVVDPDEDEQHPRPLRRPRPPPLQSFPFQPVPSRPVRAQDLETGRFQTPTAPDISLLKIDNTPRRHCRQYLSEGVNVSL